ncbi:MAG: hypothetical protein WCQ59_10070 [Candidatus Cloacimonadaceae bacterium]
MAKHGPVGSGPVFSGNAAPGKVQVIVMGSMDLKSDGSQVQIVKKG